jgi:hypothetical protein
MPRGLLLFAGFLAMLARHQPQAIIEGTILDAAGAPLADAGVVLIRPPILTLAQSTSSADGTFRLEVSDTGAAQLQFFAPGRGYFYLPILVDPALHATLERLAAPDDSFACRQRRFVPHRRRPGSWLSWQTQSEQSRYQFWSRRGSDSAGYDWKPAVAKAKQLAGTLALVRQALPRTLRFRRLGSTVRILRSSALREPHRRSLGAGTQHGSAGR